MKKRIKKGTSRKVWLELVFLMAVLSFAFPQLNRQEKEVVKTIQSYYQACQEENLEAYLNLMYLKDRDQNYLAREAQEVWAAVDTLDYSLSNFQIAFSQDQHMAVVRYEVKATITKEGGQPHERFHLQANYFMTLHFENGTWKVGAIQREDIFTQNIKSLYSFQMTREYLDELAKFDEEEKSWSAAEVSPSKVRPAPSSRQLSEAEELIFEDDFNQESLSSAWVVQSGEWVVAKGKLKAVGQNGILWLAKEMPDDLAVEIEVRGNYDLNVAIAGNGGNHPGYLFSVGGWWNTKSALVEGEKIVMVDPLVKIENPQRASLLRIERNARMIKCFLNGRLVFTYDKADLKAEEGFNKISLRNWGYPLIFDNLKVYDLRKKDRKISAEPQRRSRREQSGLTTSGITLSGTSSKTQSKIKPETLARSRPAASLSSLSEDKHIMKVKELEPKHYLQYITASHDGKKVLALEKDKSVAGWFKGGSRVILIDVEWGKETVLMAGNDTIELVPGMIYRPLMLKGDLPVFGFAMKESPSQTGYYLYIGGRKRRIDAQLFQDYLEPLRNFDIHVDMVSSPVPYGEGFLAIFKVDLPTSLAFKYGSSEYISFCFIGEVNQGGSGVRVWGGPSIQSMGGRPVLTMKGPMIEAPLRLVPVSLPTPGVVIFFTGMNIKGQRGLYSTTSSKPLESLNDWINIDFFPARGSETIMRVVSESELGGGESSRPMIQLYNLSRGEARVLRTDLSGTAMGLGGIPVFALSPNRWELVAVKSDLNALLVVDLGEDTRTEINLGDLTVDLAGFGHAPSIYSSPVARKYIYFTAINGDRSDLYVVKRGGASSLPSTVDQELAVGRSKEKSSPLAYETPGLTGNIPDIRGVWDTNFGRLTITQDGYKIRGKYTHDDGQIEGVLIGRTLKGKWSEAPSYLPPHDAGEFEFTFAEDFKSFTGKWRYGYETQAWNGEWFGSKLK